MMGPKQGEVYQHFKGKEKLYRVIAVALDSEDPKRKIVVYEQLYDSEDFPRGTIWVRELNDFMGEREKDGIKVQRFVKIK